MSDRAKPMRQHTDLHVLSHEVRTPLNGILGSIAMLDEFELSEEVRNIVSRIEIAAEGLNQQLNNAIEVQRIAAKKVIFAQRDYSLLEVAEASIRLFATEAESRGVDLTLQFDPRLHGKQFIGDQERLTQILSALISNSVKFTDSGSVTLVIGLRKEKVAASQVIFKVFDSGIGIPEAELPFICEASYQVESATEGRPRGTGAGLYIASSLLKLLASNLDIRSNTAGTQASFVLDLPASSSPTVGYNRSAETARVSVFSPPNAQIELLCSTLESFNVEVSAQASLSSANTADAVDLMLVDYRVAAQNLALFRRLVKESPVDKLCLLSTEFEPATALLSKGCKQWNSPYLPSGLFELCLKAEVLKQNHQQADSNAVITLPEDLSSYTLLCVDDSPTNLIVLIGALTKLGFNRVIRAKDGQEAVEVMREHPEIDLILMDFHMPRLNGAEAARQIRQEGADIPILGVTALSEADLKSEVQDDDFEMVITKPVRVPILSEALARHLRPKAQRIDL